MGVGHRLPTGDDVSLFGPEGGADFSRCCKYRYFLWRQLAPGERRVLFIMLNPSTADETQDDPTIRRCIGYARSWGFARLGICNIFALRSTDPGALYDHPDPVGPDNDAHISMQARAADMVVCAWGAHGVLSQRSAKVRKLLAGVPLHFLKLTGLGEPGHPLYLRADVRPTRWETP